MCPEGVFQRFDEDDGQRQLRDSYQREEYLPARFEESLRETGFRAVMGERRVEPGVKRWLMVRPGDEFSEKPKYAHGTGGLGFLRIWKDLVVQERISDNKVYAFRTLDEVLERKYSWFEHVGDGLWARCTILVEGVFSGNQQK